MTKPTIFTIVVGMLVVTLCALPVFAGGALETFDITDNQPSPVAGQILANVIGIKWDARCMPVRYSQNTTLDPIPNPLGTGPVVTVAQAVAAQQASFDSWNKLRNSFIDMRITGTTTNPGLRGFDMVNELTFRTSNAFAAIASSPSTVLIADATFAVGDLIDNDADVDVFDPAVHGNTCQDFDGDGDIDFPAGFYEAGTILDNDVQYNTKAGAAGPPAVAQGFRFTVNDADIDNVALSVDLITVATHEFGHSHGLSHSFNNQRSNTDGDGATMFPFIATGDPVSELQQRSLDIDDIAWSSFFYPEGTATSGPGALQSGDRAFSKSFGLIRGELRHGFQNRALVGANVFAVDNRRRTLSSSTFTGHTRLSFNPNTGQLFFLADPAVGIVDGNFVIPVPEGAYRIGVEAVDSAPAAGGNISFTCQVGAFYGQQNFNEQFFVRLGGDDDDDDEERTVEVDSGRTRANVNYTTRRDTNIDNFGSLDSRGFTGAPAGRYYAVRIPASQVTALAPELLVKAGNFVTGVADASVIPLFAEAMLTTGTVSADARTATINLAKPLRRTTGFLGQETDAAAFEFRSNRSLTKQIRKGIANGSIQNLFLVLRVPTNTPFPGFNGLPPLIGIDTVTATTAFGHSYFSDDGGVTFNQRRNAAGNLDFNFMFGLVFTEPPVDNDHHDDDDDHDDD